MKKELAEMTKEERFSNCRNSLWSLVNVIKYQDKISNFKVALEKAISTLENEGIIV